MPHTIIALHCWASAGREYDALRPLLPDVELLAPDLPGFGSQPVPAGFDYSVQAYADWVAAYIGQNGVTDFTLIGHSMSGKMALALAARQPAGLRRLVLLSPSPPAGEPMTDADRAASIAAYGQPRRSRKTFRKITVRPLSAETRAHVIADNLRSTEPRLGHLAAEEGAREDITCPNAAPERTLPPAGGRRRHIPFTPCLLSAALRCRCCRPALRSTVVPDTGHLLPLEAAAEVRRVAGLKTVIPTGGRNLSISVQRFNSDSSLRSE